MRAWMGRGLQRRVASITTGDSTVPGYMVSGKKERKRETMYCTCGDLILVDKGEVLFASSRRGQESPYLQFLMSVVIVRPLSSGTRQRLLPGSRLNTL